VRNGDTILPRVWYRDVPIVLTQDNKSRMRQAMRDYYGERVKGHAPCRDMRARPGHRQSLSVAYGSFHWLLCSVRWTVIIADDAVTGPILDKRRQTRYWGRLLRPRRLLCPHNLLGILSGCCIYDDKDHILYKDHFLFMVCFILAKIKHCFNLESVPGAILAQL